MAEHQAKMLIYHYKLLTLCLGQFPGQKKVKFWPKMDILPLKYVQITKRGLRIMHFLVYSCRFVGSDHVS